MKTYKRILAFLLTAVMVFAGVPFTGATFLASAAAKYMWPVVGNYSVSRWNSSSHYGVDITNSGNVQNPQIISTYSGTVTQVYNECSCTGKDHPYYDSKGNYIGMVTCLDHRDTYGNMVKVLNDDGTTSVYGHLKYDSICVKVGDRVSQGQVLGLMGDSGVSTGIHLHFEIRTGSSQSSCIDLKNTSFLPADIFVNYTSPPTDGWLWVEKEVAGVGEDIKLNFNATDANRFVIGIWKDNKEYAIIDNGYSDWYTINFSESGIYSVHVACYNNLGHCDSNYVNIFVYGNLGDDFCGIICNSKMWRPIAVDENNYISLQKESGNAEQIWNFTRQTDGSYVITSALNGKVLEFYYGSNSVNPVFASSFDGGYDYQRWYICPVLGGFCLLSKQDTNKNLVLDLENQSTDYGTQLVASQFNRSESQVLAVYNQQEVQLKNPQLEVQGNTSGKETAFIWDDVYGEYEYNLRIFKDGVEYKSVYLNSNSYEIMLPSGEYTAFVRALNYFTYTQSDTINFSVAKAATYDVLYNSNGGNGAPSAQTKTYGAALTLSSTKPTRTGYTFAGWNTKADGSGTSYAAGASYTANSAVTLYAQWTANPYTVTFNANGGACSTASMSVTYNSTYGTLPTPTRTGYTFNGWFTAASGGTKVTTDTTVTITAAQTLYAQWTVNTYTIEFNGNGSTSGSMANLSMTYGTAKNLTANVFVKTGYTFNGWNTKADGSGSVYTDKESVNNLTATNGATVTLYAQWKINTFSVSFNANGGSGAPSAQTKNYGTDLVLSSTQPTRTDYIFTGWNTRADGTGVSYQPGDKYTDNKAVTLYAIWELAHKHVYTSSVTKQPTCTEKGIKKFTCPSCGDTYTEDIAALGHNHIGSVTEPTCSEQGFTTYTCSRCNDSYIDKYTNSLNHPSSTWHTAINPTPASNGLAEKRCDYCNHVLDQFVIPNLNPDYVTGISLSSQKETVEIGDVFTLTASIIPDTAKNKNIIWSSRNPDIVSVDNGVVKAIKPGSTAIVAKSEDGGFIDFCLVRVVSLVAINGAVIDNDSNIIYGLTCNLNSVDDYLEPVDNNMSISLSTATVGTGTTISIIDNGEVIDSYEAIIFGDVNGDGWYDGEDAFLVNLIVAGLLTEDKLPDYMWTAADCNHDGVIDEVDVDLLMGAGVRRNDIDQNATQAELATQTAYIEYASLIDQSAGMYPDIAPIPDMDGIPEDTTIPETNETVEPDGPVSEDHMDFEVIFTNIFEFIKKILSLIFSFII